MKHRPKRHEVARRLEKSSVQGDLLEPPSGPVLRPALLRRGLEGLPPNKDWNEKIWGAPRAPPEFEKIFKKSDMANVQNFKVNPKIIFSSVGEAVWTTHDETSHGQNAG